MDHINDCALYSEMIFAYAEELISDEKAGGDKTPDKEKWKALLAHLEVCESCRKELSECEKMLREVEEEPIEVPEDLHGSIMSRVKSEAKAARRRRFTKMMGGIAAVFVLVVGVFAVMNSGAFNATNDAMAADGDVYWNGGANPGDAAPEAEDKASGEIFDGADGDLECSSTSKEQSKADNAVNDQVDIDDVENIEEVVETEMTAEAVDPEPGSAVTTPETLHSESETPVDAGSDSGDMTDVLEAFIKTTEFSGGVGYYVTGDGDGKVFDKVTRFSEWDSYSYGEYLILLIKPELLEDIDAELSRLSGEYETELETFTFGEKTDCVAVVIKW